MFGGERRWRKIAEKIGRESQRELENYAREFDSWLDQPQIQDAGIDTDQVREQIEKTRNSGQSEEYAMKTIQKYRKAIEARLKEKEITAKKMGEPAAVEELVALGDTPSLGPEKEIETPVTQEPDVQVIEPAAVPPVPDTPANVDIVIEEHVEEDTTTPASNEAETEEDPTGEDVVEDSVSESREDDAQASESETTVAPPDQE
ncbi:hypothetical protein HOF40_03000 [Candidatus Parcubacteria bacterium]|nr:hypothetical protein [Candidatus Parcubacteria bacterium]